MGEEALAEFVESVERLADRFRAMPQSRLLGAVPGHASRAAAALALAQQLADAAQRLEEGPRAAARTVPDAGVFAVGDQLAVAGHDLVTALVTPSPFPAALDAPGPDAGEVLARAAAAVAEVGALCG
ncbi:hypothetical protein OG500_22930 [Kitasatospora sp. NBC_01250]|uniref:hypothetical protein n=1 Tax=unclassified Kitasatospora TaxID=2633591 RepID=UPI002E0FA26F|nr:MULTISPECIES: hypothetical protein [unclassified Kitasatospora]WSJ68888.1 hypothetical protein OG294_23780 [Kitasatospora sp. NBC_01302]